ncbi:hypothetical protein EDB84DRAFT_1567794 [Lactarius hengduanensis]|nr:hypothetical protein EDB84DRAFT_1567794 [Lactarius hengduanensis]
MKATPPKQPGDTVPKIPLWEEPGTPPLQSMYSHIWPRDMDTDYSESESDSSGSSEEWEGSSESGLGSDSEEDSDSDDVDGEGLKLTADQADMLQKHVAEFRAADLHRRLAIVKDCLNWIQARQPKASFKRKEVETLVRRYLYNKGRRAKKSSTLNLGRRWTYRDIVMDVHRQELHTMTLSLSDSKGGSDKYLACYQKALKIVQAGLSQETKEKYRAQAKKWTEDIPPPRQQRKMMQKYGMSTFREFARYVYSQYGVRVAILGAYQDGDGDPSITFFDINEKLGGTSFKRRHENWQHDQGMGEDFSKWAAKSFGKGTGDNSDDDGEKKSKDAPEINLKTDSRGYPILPSWEAVKDTDHRNKKYLIGKYMSEMYQMASEGRKGRIPWTRVREAQQDYILDKYLPAGKLPDRPHSASSKGTKILGRSKTANIGTGNGDEADLDGIKIVQPEEDNGESQGGGKDSAAEDGAAEDPGPSRRPQPRRRRLPGSAGPNKVHEEPTAELPMEGDFVNPPRQQQPLSLPNRPQLSPAAKVLVAPPPDSQSQSPLQGRSPQTVMRKPWADKFSFLESLSKDGKYQDLLLEINKMFLSDRVISIEPSTQHPTWASWTWTQMWLPEVFHSGGDKPVWQWLQSRPYVPDLSLEGVRRNFSVDGIALGIGSLLHDLEAMQFSDEIHPPEHVAHSKVSFGVVGSIIYPALDNFLEIIKDHNNFIATDDSQELPTPVAPPSASAEREGKRHRNVKGTDDSDADSQIRNRQKVDPKIGAQARRSGRVKRPTERAKVTQESGDASARKDSGKKGANQ